MKKFALFLLPLLAFAFTACEEEESELRFSTESISNPDNIQIEYYSPDPMHCPKTYSVTANSEAGELTLKCIDADAIYIANELYYYDPDSYPPSSFTCTEGRWTAELVSPNTVTITLDKIEYDPDASPTVSSYALALAANTKKGKLSTGIYITRLLNSSQPLQ